MENKQPQTAPADVRENIMGTMDINPLLIKLSVPMMISMLVQALYNVVDSIFVSHVSENALTAVSLAFSLQNVMIAVGVGTGVGVNALLSKSLGEKDQERANKTAENGIFLSLCSYAVFLLIGLTCMKPYFYAQTSDMDIAQQGILYLSICCVLSLGLFTQTMGEKLLAATGRTHLSMISQLVGAVVNIVLDPIFIFGYCGEALSGTTGAAVATVIGQFCGAGMTLYFNLNKNPDIQISFRGFRPSAKTIGRIYTVGLPSIAMQCVGSVMTFFMNHLMTKDGTRLRANIYHQRNNIAATYRILRSKIPTFQELHVPDAIRKLILEPRGLILITGPTGSGKTTTLASMIDYVNQKQAKHVMTIEDPIEYVYYHAKSMIHQREVGRDVDSFAKALRSSLREDPDIILVGEMRDYETISAAITAAETGHLVLSTLHTTSAAQTIERIIDAYPAHGQSQARTQLANVLRGIVTQQLIPMEDGTGMAMATEILINTDAIANQIRENKTHQIVSSMQGGAALGMHTLNADLKRLVREQKITEEMARKYSTNVKDFEMQR